jgi:soluble lytic murein transglycosylase-like protein
MLSNFNIPILTKYAGTDAEKRISSIDTYLSTVDAKNTDKTVSFSQLMPNTKDNQPVRLINPDVMINIIKHNARKYGVDPKLVNAIIKNESGYNANARSSSGAVGLMQLMPQTAKEMEVTDMNDPAQNVEGGTKYLSKLLNQFNGNTVLAVAAYNAGPNSVKQNGGIPPYKETQNYVMKVLDTYLSST